MTAISGMTGFGRSEGAEGGWTWAVEARSVNGRNLEVRFRGPPGFDRLEPLAKASAQKRFGRGQVTVGVQAKRTDPGAAALKVNDDILARYLTLANRLAEEGATPPSADGLLALRGVLDAGDEVDADTQKALEAAIAEDVAVALDGLKAARLDEGERLTPVLQGFLDAVERLAMAARREADAQTTAIRERFTRRVAELTEGAADLEDRVFQEAAVLAGKADVREELDRLDAHTASARDLIGQGGAVGRKLDFLTQEFMREANTLCSKAATVALTGLGLDLKAVIEQFREQVQNVE